jgi:hypothetical protein
MDQNQKEDESLVEEDYAEDVGNLAIKSALMKFIAAIDEDEAASFASYIEGHAEAETFLEDLCNEYPEFEKVLEEEMLVLQKELNDIVPE